MGLFSFFSRKAATASPAVIASINDGTANFVTRLGGTNERVVAAYNRALTGGYGIHYARSPAVRTVIDLIARNIGQLDVGLFEHRGDAERQPMPDHPAALSVRYPNPTLTQDAFIRAVVTDKLIYNNAFVLLGGALGPTPTSLWPIPAHRVEVLGNGFIPVAYIIHWPDGNQSDLIPADAMFHWRDWNPIDPRIGVSPLETLRNVIAEDAALQAAIVELNKSGLAEPVWVSRSETAPDWSNEARKRFEEDLHNRLGRSSTYPPVIEEGMELHGFGISPRDAQSFETRKYALQQIASEYGVPLGMVGLDSNVAEAQSEFYADTLPPICEAFACELNHSIVQGVYGETDLQFKFDLDEKLMGDERIKTLTAAAGAPILLRDEARSRLNLEPLPDGIGKRPVIPANIQEEDGTSTGLPSIGVMPPQNPAGPAQDGSARQGDPYTQSSNGHGKKIEVSTLPRRTRDMNRQRAYIGEVKKVLERHVTRQANGKALDARASKELVLDLDPLITSIFEREGNLYVGRLAGDSFDVGQVRNYIAAMSAEVAKEFISTMRSDIADGSLSDAIDRARNQRVDVMSRSIGTRATTKARTEAARQAPFSQHRVQTWIADTDRHADLDGASVPLGSDWGGITPGSEPNCACSMEVS